MSLTTQMSEVRRFGRRDGKRSSAYTESSPRRFDTSNIIASFIISAALVLLIGMLLFGTWVTQRSTDAILKHSAHTAAMFMDSAIEPLVQELADHPQLSAQSIDAIDRLLTNAAISQKLTSIIIWRRDGAIAYSRNRDLIGRTDTMTEGLTDALEGKVGIEHLGPGNSSSANDGSTTQGAYKVYSPMHMLGTSDVIAAAGYVEPPHALDNLLAQGRRDTWVVVGIFTLFIFGLTFNLVHHASEMIKEQNKYLRERYVAQVRLNLQNELLQKELHEAHQEGIAINEKFLRRVSADLHDGPAQFLALALLRIDDLAPNKAATDHAMTASDAARKIKALETVRSATQKALSEIRSISTGLALPELQDLSPSDVIGSAVNAFVSATQTKVSCTLTDLPDAISLPWTVCLYRFVQEGLSNGYRHAGGNDLEVRAGRIKDELVFDISDKGPGFHVDQSCNSARLGLAGLRHRIEVLGGKFEIKSVVGVGTTITLAIPFSELNS